MSKHVDFLSGGECPACGNRESISLPSPSAERSVLSDGRIMERRLDKVACRACGLIRHRASLTHAEILSLYNEDYNLPGQASLADDARGEAYARVVADVLGAMPILDRLLEIGCGSGAAARFLVEMLPVKEIRGVDPALPEEYRGTSGKVTLARGLLEDTSEPAWFDFDAVVSINTIEHTRDPAEFLRSIAVRLRPKGKAVLVCPVATPANCELLFYDHLWTLTPASFLAFAAAAGLRIAQTLNLDQELACFQVFVVEKGEADPQPPVTAHSAEAVPYLAAWQGLDSYWCDQIDALGGRVQIFGAGQMAAVIRAYAPRTWARAERLVVDNPDDAWNLGRVERYVAEEHARGYSTIIAVNPLIKGAVAERIRRDGGKAIVMPDTIQF